MAALLSERRRPVQVVAVAAGVLSLAHSFTTTRAAPIMLELRHPGGDERALADTLDRFERWHSLRVMLQLATLAASLEATVLARARERAPYLRLATGTAQEALAYVAVPILLTAHATRL